MTFSIASARCANRLAGLRSQLAGGLAAVLLAACAGTGGSAIHSTPNDPDPTGTAASLAAPVVTAQITAIDPSTETAPAPVPVDPLQPDVRLNLDDRSAQVDLWQRVRRGFAMPDLDSDLVRTQEQWYASRPDYVARMTERGGRYLFHIVEELDRRGMPTELALLPFIESAYNPQAMSTAKASGMWQFIPGTGKDYLLKQNIFRDDRRDVLASTRAALDHLQRLYGMFGDWQLALAAYNWGEGNVARAIARNQKLGLPTDYQSLKMPAETATYVPKLQAVKNIVARPSDFGLGLPVLLNRPYFLAVPIERDMDVDVAIRLAAISSDEFHYLNPQMNKPVILAAGTPQVLLPYDNANQFVRSLPLHRGALSTWTAWVAPKTLHPAEAARLTGMSEARMREVNRIPARMLVKAGSTLLVPRGTHGQDDVPLAVADNATMALSPDTPPLRKVSLKAGHKDTVASIAKRYRVSTAQVAQWNDTAKTASFKPGQPIVVFVAAKLASTKSARAAPAPMHSKTAHAGAMKSAAATTTRARAVAHKGMTSHVASTAKAAPSGGN